MIDGSGGLPPPTPQDRAKEDQEHPGRVKARGGSRIFEAKMQRT
jgi:hypothetical protein